MKIAQNISVKFSIHKPTTLALNSHLSRINISDETISANFPADIKSFDFGWLNVAKNKIYKNI